MSLLFYDNELYEVFNKCLKMSKSRKPKKDIPYNDQKKRKKNNGRHNMISFILREFFFNVLFNQMKNKSYSTVGTVSKFNSKIVETEE